MSWIAFSQDPVIIQQSEEALKQIKSELNDILVSKFEGAMIRTRAKLLEQGEKPTRYFLQMEKLNNLVYCLKASKVLYFFSFFLQATEQMPPRIWTVCLEFLAH